MSDATLPTIFVVDDDVSVRRAIQRLLVSAGFQVIVCDSAREYLERFDPSIPGCLVLDLAMPGVSGLELQESLATKGDAPPIIFLSGHAEIPDSVRAMRHGAVEFLTKPVDGRLLMDAIALALERDRVDRQERAEAAEIRERLARLTVREREVLVHVVGGLLNKQIASRLGTVEKTIKVHRARVMEKLEVRSLAALVRFASRAGIIPPSDR